MKQCFAFSVLSLVVSACGGTNANTDSEEETANSGMLSIDVKMARWWFGMSVMCSSSNAGWSKGLPPAFKIVARRQRDECYIDSASATSGSTRGIAETGFSRSPISEILIRSMAMEYT